MTNKEAAEIVRAFREAMDTPITEYRDILLDALDMAIDALEEVTTLKRVISLLAIGGIPPEKQLIDFGYTKEDWVYMLKTVMGIIEENSSCATSEVEE